MSARYYEIYNFNGSYILSISRLDRLQQSPYHNLQPQNADPTSTVPAPAAGAELQWFLCIPRNTQLFLQNIKYTSSLYTYTYTLGPIS
jgi:hypothetical protein